MTEGDGGYISGIFINEYPLCGISALTVGRIKLIHILYTKSGSSPQRMCCH